jgi:hypothetical protein
MATDATVPPIGARMETMTTVSQRGRSGPTPRTNRGRFARDPAATVKANTALECYIGGMSWEEAGREAGYRSSGAAHNAAMRLLEGRTAPNVASLRLIENERLDAAYRQLLAVIADPGYVTSAGRLVLGPDGEPMPDRAVVVDAINALIRLSQRLARMNGMDAPTASIQVRAAADMDADIEALLMALYERAAQARQRQVVRGELATG